MSRKANEKKKKQKKKQQQKQRERQNKSSERKETPTAPPRSTGDARTGTTPPAPSVAPNRMSFLPVFRRLVMNPLGAVLGIGSALLSVVIALYSVFFFFPQVTPPPIDRGASPLWLPFAIANKSWLPMPMYDVEMSCIIEYAKYPNQTITWARSFIEPKGRLNPGDSAPYRCFFQVEDGYSELRIVMLATYRQPLWPWNREKELRFFVVKRRDGSAYWVEGVPLGHSAAPIPESMKIDPAKRPRK